MTTNLIAIVSTLLLTNTIIEWPKSPLTLRQGDGFSHFTWVAEDDTNASTRNLVLEVLELKVLKVPGLGYEKEISRQTIYRRAFPQCRIATWVYCNDLDADQIQNKTNIWNPALTYTNTVNIMVLTNLIATNRMIWMQEADSGGEK